eukprot:comp15926_c0_seq1/m.24858 comp15926_c0_seq1/g.24858  ORF comp15926_c0_seq1/g.24858 comp15926_c0_seq1/m.24858 type:complete len:215 (+) comp15926_c0_seq1:105-749(+)
MAENYKNRTLVGNWFEDRFLREDTQAAKVSREPEIEFKYVPRISRKFNKSTAQTIHQTDDKHYGTEQRGSFIDPSMYQKVTKKREPVITHKNFNRALEPRPLNRPARGFGAALPIDRKKDDDRVTTSSNNSSYVWHGERPETLVSENLTVFPREEGGAAGLSPKGHPQEKDIYPFGTLKAVTRNDYREKSDFKRKTGFTKDCEGIWRDAESIIN